MNERSPAATGPDAEPRWPPILAYVFVFGFVQLLPNRYHVLGPWVPWALFAVGVGSMLAVAFAPTSFFWRRVERAVIVGIFAIVCILTITTVVKLVADMLATKHGFGGITLLETGAQIWLVNLVSFALLYWQVDSAGAQTHANDFDFAEKDRPRFVDYLFLAFGTSTSFMPPDYARPVSHRAKLMLMLQALISLTTLFLIAARAVSTLA